jgi:hypothetical protein
MACRQLRPASRVDVRTGTPVFFWLMKSGVKSNFSDQFIASFIARSHGRRAAAKLSRIT